MLSASHVSCRLYPNEHELRLQSSGIIGRDENDVDDENEDEYELPTMLCLTLIVSIDKKNALTHSHLDLSN